MSRKYILTFLILPLLFVTCKKHDGYDAALIEYVEILDTPDGDQLIEVSEGENWAKFRIIGKWYDQGSIDSVEIDKHDHYNECSDINFNYFETFTTTKIFATIPNIT